MFRLPQNPKSRWGPNPAFPLSIWKQQRERLKNAVLELAVRILSCLHGMQGLFLSPPFLSWGRGGPTSGSLWWFTERTASAWEPAAQGTWRTDLLDRAGRETLLRFLWKATSKLQLSRQRGCKKLMDVDCFWAENRENLLSLSGEL